MSNQKLYVVLDNIRSRENVGSIFRTADAVGVSKIYLCGITPVPDESNPSTGSGFANKIAKTALGAEKWIPWEYHKQTWRLLKKLKNHQLHFYDMSSKVSCCIIALEKTPKSINIFKHAPYGSEASRSGFKKPENYSIILVVGNEIKGLSPKILKYCDEVVHIPMYGKKESLNVAVAAGVAIYQIQNSNYKF